MRVDRDLLHPEAAAVMEAAQAAEAAAVVEGPAAAAVQARRRWCR